MLKPRVLTLVAIVFAAAATRLLPHPLNFAPIAGMALFGGAHFSDKRLAFAVPLIAMFLSDLLLGFHIYLPFVYASFALIVGVGFLLQMHRRGCGEGEHENEGPDEGAEHVGPLGNGAVTAKKRADPSRWAALRKARSTTSCS